MVQPLQIRPSWNNCVSISDWRAIAIGVLCIFFFPHLILANTTVNLASNNSEISNIIIIQSECGAANGEVRINMVRAAANFSFQWMPNLGVGTANVKTDLEAGIYSVIITDLNDPSCVITENIYLNNKNGPAANISFNVPATCQQTNGRVVLNPSTYNYAWCDGGTGNVRTDLVAGLCNVTVTDPANGCTGFLEVVVGEGTTLIITPRINTQPTCNQANGELEWFVSGGTGNYNYEWNDGGSGMNRSNLVSGIYEVTVTDLGGTGCTATRGAVLLDDVATRASLNNTSFQQISCPGANDGAINFELIFDPGFAFPADTTFLDENGQVAVNGQFAPGSYRLQVRDNNGCLGMASLISFAAPESITLEAQITDEDCMNQGSISLLPIGGNGSYTFDWADISGNDDSQDRPSLAAATYNLSLTDANGCLLVADNLIVDDACSTGCLAMAGTISTNDPTTFCVDDAQADPLNIQVSGNSGSNYSYLLTTTAGEILEISTGAFNLEGQNAGNCLVYGIAFETPITGINIGDNIANIMGCFELSNTISVLKLTGTDCSNSCVQPIISNQFVIASSCDSTNGRILIQTLANPTNYNYQWQPAVSNSNIAENLAVGVYYVTISDPLNASCFLTDSITVANIDGPEVEILSRTPASCNQSNGTAVLTPPSFQYEWCNGGQGFNGINLPAGPCFVTVTDPAGGCSTIVEIFIDTHVPLLTEAIIDVPADCGQANGAATIDVMDGSTNYSFAWSNGGNTPSQSNLAAGVYEVTVTDLGITGCVNVVTFAMPENVASANLMVDSLIYTSCAGASDGTIVLSNISFEPGFVQPSRTEIIDKDGQMYTNGALPPGFFCALIYDNNNCLAGQACFEVADAPAIEVKLDIVQVSCDSLAVANMIVTGGDGNYSYRWADLPAATSDSVRRDMAVGNYSLTITDGRGCTAMLSNIAIIDACNPCPVLDTLIVAVLANETRSVCVPLEYCYDAANTFFALASGGLGGSTVLGTWALENGGCVSYQANGMVGQGDTVYVVASYNGLLDTTCLFFSVVDDPAYNPANDTLYLTTNEDMAIDSCLSILALTGPLASSNILLAPTGGQLTVGAADNCISYLPALGTTGNFVDTAWVELCDVNNICDTFTLIFTVVPANCSDIIAISQENVVEFDCNQFADYCLGIPLFDILDYRLLLDGEAYTGLFNGCDIIPITSYDMQELFLQFPMGPYILDQWTVNAQSFMLGSFNTIEQLVDSMQVWDPAGNWVYDGTRTITGGAAGSNYGQLVIRRVGFLTQIRVDLFTQNFPQGTLISLPVGMHQLIINDLATACQDTILLDVECRTCPTVYNGPDSLIAADCDAAAALCLDISPTNLPNHEFFDNGLAYTGAISGCLFDTSYLYSVADLQSGPFRLNSWIVNNDTLRLANFADAQELLAAMNTFDPSGNWQLVGQLIIGGGAGNTYSPIIVSQNGIPLPTIPLVLQTTAIKIAMELDTGMHQIIIRDTLIDCSDTIDLRVVCNVGPMMGGLDTLLFVFDGETDTFCIDISAFDSLSSILNICPSQSDGDVGLTFLAEDGCLALSGMSLDVDTFCIEVCDSIMAICDTFRIAVQVLPDIDTIPLIVKLGFSDTLCLDTTIFKANIDTLYNICPTASGTEVAFTLIDPSCVVFEGLDLGQDTACIVLCDELNNCDTTILLVNVMAPQPDTVIRSVLVGATDVFCVDTSELSGTVDTIYNICPGSSGVFVDFEIIADSICVRFTGLDMGLDTACLVFCDDLICDTTYLIVDAIRGSLEPPIAVDDDTTTFKNMPVNIRILLNDTINGSSPEIFLLRPPTVGSVVINPDFTVTYLSDPEVCNQRDSFEYILRTSTGEDTATVSIFIQCEDLTIYSGFSPNGDNVNDTFVIPGIENFPDNTVCIFNRWGNQVFCTNGYTNIEAWDGTWNGKDLPDGTYFYLIEDGRGRKFSGYVQLNR